MPLLRFFYNILIKLASVAGFTLVMRIKAKGYEPIFSRATYAPWLSDRSYNETYEIIKDYTMVDQYRCYELWQLVGESAKLTGALMEVGVWRGGSGTLIAKKAQLSRIKDTVYLCDTFEGVVKAGDKDSEYKGGEHADTSKETVEEVINKLELDNTKILVGIFPHLIR